METGLTIASLITSIGDVLAGVLSWVNTAFTSLFANPVLLFGLCFGIVIAVIGFVVRLVVRNAQ